MKFGGHAPTGISEAPVPRHTSEKFNVAKFSVPNVFQSPINNPVLLVFAVADGLNSDVTEVFEILIVPVTAA